MKLPSETPLLENAAKIIEAAGKLYEKVQSGTYWHNGKKRPINGDLTKLAASETLSSLEKLLLGGYARVTRKISGLISRTKTLFKQRQ